jgi:hypothetical protein
METKASTISLRESSEWIDSIIVHCRRIRMMMILIMIPRLSHTPGTNKTKIGHQRQSPRLKNRTSNKYLPRNPLCGSRKSPPTTLPRLERHGIPLRGELVMLFKVIWTKVKTLRTRSRPFVKPRPSRRPSLKLLVRSATHHPNDLVVIPDNDVPLGFLVQSLEFCPRRRRSVRRRCRSRPLKIWWPSSRGGIKSLGRGEERARQVPHQNIYGEDWIFGHPRPSGCPRHSRLCSQACSWLP